jgi:hypothetical protein
LIRVFVLIKKLPHLTDEQFHAHWRHPHGTLTLRMPQLLGYVQNHGIGARPMLPGLPSTPYLGVPVIQLASIADLEAMAADPRYKPLHEDALLLYDQQDVVWLVMNPDGERAQSSAPPGSHMINALLLLRRSPQCPAVQFQRGVRELSAALQAAAGHGCESRLSLPDPAFYDGKDAPRFDALIEMRFEQIASFEKGWAASATGDLLSTAQRSLLDPLQTCGFLAQEERFI